jgi:hypothetical protein
MVSFAPDPRQELKEMILGMCEGNPGAMSVLMAIPRSVGIAEALKIFDQMKEMKIVGPNVWLAFKDASGEDLGKMIESIRNNDARLIQVINRWVEPGRQARLRD